MATIHDGSLGTVLCEVNSRHLTARIVLRRASYFAGKAIEWAVL